MGDIVERMNAAIDKNIDLDISMMSDGLKEKYRATFCAESAEEIDRLNRERSEARNNTLEEAAKVADQAHDEWESDSRLWHKEGMLKTAAASLFHAEAAAKVAAAIRKLKETGE